MLPRPVSKKGLSSPTVDHCDYNAPAYPHTCTGLDDIQVSGALILMHIRQRDPKKGSIPQLSICGQERSDCVTHHFYRLSK